MSQRGCDEDIKSNLFEMAPGIKEPLYIKNISFDEEIGELVGEYQQPHSGDQA